jgi:hypothetical protein
MVPALIKTTFLHTTSHNPAGWGAFFERIHLDLYGPVGSLPFTVTGSNNTAELQAPLEAIAFMMLHPPSPPTSSSTSILNMSSIFSLESHYLPPIWN